MLIVGIHFFCSINEIYIISSDFTLVFSEHINYYFYFY